MVVFSDLTVALCHDDSAKPPRKGERVLQLVKFCERLEERALCGIFGLVRIAQRSSGVKHDHGLKPAHQFGEGLISLLFLGFG